MKYNLRKQSLNSLDLTDDREKRSLAYEEWRRSFVDSLEQGNIDGVVALIKENKDRNGFGHFLMSMLPQTRDLYDEELYSGVLSTVKDSDVNVREKINE